MGPKMKKLMMKTLVGGGSAWIEREGRRWLVFVGRPGRAIVLFLEPTRREAMRLFEQIA